MDKEMEKLIKKVWFLIRRPKWSKKQIKMELCAECKTTQGVLIYLKEKEGKTGAFDCTGNKFMGYIKRMPLDK